MKKPKIGVVPGYFHEDPDRPVYKNMKLLYVDEAINRWLSASGAYPLLLPTPDSSLTLDEILEPIDGLLLQGGPDIAADILRDDFELKAIRAALDRGIPVLGVCRGIQSINVALGGSLYQDIGAQNEGAFEHRRADVYEKNSHEIEFTAGSRLQEIYGGIKTAKVNSIHHQAIKEVADGLEVEARSVTDGIIEAVRLKSGKAYAAGVQWHPEWMDPKDGSLLDTSPLLKDFLDAVQAGSPRV